MNTRNRDRFVTVQLRAVEIISHTEILRMVCETDKRDGDQPHRVAGTVGGLFVAYSCERAYAALKELDKCKTIRPISGDDYERFVERCVGIAGALGISTSKVEDGFLRVAEIAINHSEEALVRVTNAYKDEGLDLATRSNTPKFDVEDAYISRLEREKPELKNPDDVGTTGPGCGDLKA